MIRSPASRVTQAAGANAAADCEEASMHCDHSGAVARVILLDIEMTRMDGSNWRRTYARARLLHSVVMITSASGKHRARAIEIGCNAYIGKPIRKQWLDASNPSHGQKWRMSGKSQWSAAGWPKSWPSRLAGVRPVSDVALHALYVWPAQFTVSVTPMTTLPRALQSLIPLAQER